MDLKIRLVKSLKLLCIVLLILNVATKTFAQQYEENWASIDSRPIPKWYKDAKFGIFIHWGIYVVPSFAPVGKDFKVYSKYAEWYWYRLEKDTTKVGKAFRDFHHQNYGAAFKYADFVNSFKAELFNPNQWADLFKASGAKYVVLTSKHHEGFALWPSKESKNWNSMDAGPKRDLAGDLTKAVKAQNLHMGFYYSLYEWFNPLYKSNVNSYVADYMVPQMKDLVNRYQPDILWTDGEWDHPSETWKSTSFLSWLYKDSPVKNSIVVNDRWGKETRGKHGGFYTTEYDLIHDSEIKNSTRPHPWEECRGMGGSFGYNRNESLQDYSSSEQLIHLLIDKVSKGGNLLLNIGPAADGTIPVIMQQRLTDIGRWLKVNGEAIYGTEQWIDASKINQNNIYFTKKGEDLYIITTQWQEKIVLDGFLKRPGKISLLGSQKVIKNSYNNEKLTIKPSPMINNPPCNYAWAFKIEDCL